MTIVRKMLLATGSIAAIAGAAQAQLFDSGILGNFSGGSTAPLGNWATVNNLSTLVPAGNYSRYLVVTEWGNTNTVGNQWSNEARVFLGLGAANTGAASGSPTNPVASQRITSSYGAAVNSLGSGSSGTAAPRLQYWSGTMLGTGTGIGNFAAPTTVFVGGGQSFTNAATSANARWNNVRVILNHNSVTTSTNTTTLAPTGAWNAPASFTDLGTLGEGRLNLTWNTSSSAPQAWFRFVLPTAVNSGFGLLDIDTQQNGTAAPSNTDSQITLFRDLGGGALGQDGPGLSAGSDATNTWADDDSGSGLFSQLSYGSTSTDAPVGTTARSYGLLTGGTNASPYDGRDGSLPAGVYYVMVSHYLNAGALANVTTVVTGQSFNDLGGGNYSLTTNQTQQANLSIGSSTTYITNGSLNIAFVPTPGAAALLGLGGLMAARRRRA